MKFPIFPIHVDDMHVWLEDTAYNDEHMFKLLSHVKFGPNDRIQELHYYNLVYPAASLPTSMDMVVRLSDCSRDVAVGQKLGEAR